MRFVVFISILLAPFVWAQGKSAPVIEFKYHNFYHPEQGAYTETILKFKGNSLKANLKSDTLTGLELIVTQIFKQDEEIVRIDKSAVRAPLDSLGNIRDFYHIQKFALDPNRYEYELIVEDEKNQHKDLNFEKEINVEFPRSQYHLSDIVIAEFIEKSMHSYPTVFTKFGYEVYPQMSNEIFRFQNQLYYYVELNSQLYDPIDTVFVLSERVLLKNDLDSAVFERFSRISMQKFKGIAKNIALDSVYSNDYVLEIALLNRFKDVVDQKSIEFSRRKSKPIQIDELKDKELQAKFEESIPEDSIAYFVSSLIPIAHQSETRNIIKLLKKEDSRLHLKYLQAFWKNINPDSPYETWAQYKKVVEKVEERYGTSFQMGHETDRGRVYLQYGAPSQIYDIPSSPSEYPYEIWQYDRIKNLTNRRFIFYNTTNLTNNYFLLHSDMVGEIQNRRWRYELNKRNTYDNDLDDPRGTGSTDHWGRNSDLYYNSY